MHVELQGKRCSYAMPVATPRCVVIRAAAGSLPMSIAINGLDPCPFLEVDNAQLNGHKKGSSHSYPGGLLNEECQRQNCALTKLGSNVFWSHEPHRLRRQSCRTVSIWVRMTYWLGCLLAGFFLLPLLACLLTRWLLVACLLAGWLACLLPGWLLCLLAFSCTHACLQTWLGRNYPRKPPPPKKRKIPMPPFTCRFDRPINWLFLNKATKIGFTVYHIIQHTHT